MEVPYFILASLGAITILNTCITTCHGRRVKSLEGRVKVLEERPQVTVSTNTATAPYLPPAQPTYTRPVYAVAVPQLTAPRPSAPPVPTYYAQDPQAPGTARTYPYGNGPSY